MNMGHRAALVGVVSVTLALTGTAPAFAEGDGPTTTPQERAAALARPSVVYLEQHWSGYVLDEDDKAFNDGKPYSIVTRCTGFGINPDGYLATAGHCVDPGLAGIGREYLAKAVQESLDRGYYKDTNAVELMRYAVANWKLEGQVKGSPLDRRVYVQRGIAVGGKTTGEALPARLVDFLPAAEGDVALLKVEASDLPSVELATDGDIEIGTKVLSIGYPGSTDEVTDASLEPTYKDGQISAKKTAAGVPVYETNAALSGGMSGGPAVNLEGRVVGLNRFSEEQSFNFLAPAGILAELLSRNGVTPTLGSLDRLFRQGLSDYFAGHYTTAIATFDKVLSLSPTHSQAQEYKLKAAKAREKYGDSKQGSRPNGWVIALGLLGLGLLGLLGATAVVLAVILAGRRRRRAASPPPVPPAPPAAPPAAPGQVSPGMPGQAPSDVRTEPGPAPAPADRRCSGCGEPASQGSRFCASCGARLD